MLEDETVEAAAASLARLARAVKTRVVVGSAASHPGGMVEVSADDWERTTGHRPPSNVRVLVAADHWARLQRENAHG